MAADSEKLSPEQIQHALTTLLKSADDPSIQAALTHPQPIIRAYKDYKYSEGTVGFTITPAPDFKKTHQVAQSLAHFLEKALGVTPALLFEQRRFFGRLPDKKGRLALAFSDLPSLAHAINKHHHPDLKKMVAGVRTERLRAAQRESERLAEQARLAQEKQAKQAEQAAYMARRKGAAYIEGAPLVMTALCVVHATNFLPRGREDGAAEIDTTTTAHQEDVFRNTVHVALNHKVEGHMYGDWETAPYTIIGDFKETVKENGLPNALCTVDTWWTRGWNEPLTIPKALIVEPGESEDLRHISLTEAKYKTKDFTLAQAVELAGPRAYVPHDAFYKVNALLGTITSADKSGQFDWLKDNVSQFRPFWDSFCSLDKDQAGSELKTTLEQKFHFKRDDCLEIEKAFSISNNRQTINAAIDYLGYSVYPGGDYNWSVGGVKDNAKVGQSTQKLAQELGIKCGPHAGAPHFAFKKRVDSVLHQIQDGKKPDQHEIDRILDDTQIDKRSLDVATRILEKRGLKHSEETVPQTTQAIRPVVIQPPTVAPLTRQR